MGLFYFLDFMKYLEEHCRHRSISFVVNNVIAAQLTVQGYVCLWFRSVDFWKECFSM